MASCRSTCSVLLYMRDLCVEFVCKYLCIYRIYIIRSRYAEELLLRRPLWVEELCRAIYADARSSAGAAAEVSTMFEQRCRHAKEHNCGICHENFAMDNKRPDAPCRARDKSISMCNHENCTACWHALARRSDPAAAQIPCPTCRGDVKPFLAEVPYQASLQLVAGANADANSEAGDAGTVVASGSDESFEILDDASIDAGSDRSASHAESMEDDISIDGGESSDGDSGINSGGSVRTDRGPSGGYVFVVARRRWPSFSRGKWQMVGALPGGELRPLTCRSWEAGRVLQAVPDTLAR